MKKNLLVVMMMLVMVFGLVGCGKNETQAPSTDTTEVSETIPHYESDQTKTEDEIVADSGIDKENACAMETVYITIEKIGTNEYTTTLPNGHTKSDVYLNFEEKNVGKTLQINVYYFEKITIVNDPSTDFKDLEVIDYTYEVEYIVLDK